MARGSDSESASVPLGVGTIPELIEAAADRFGSRLAVEDDGTLLSFSELAARVRASAQSFIAAGIEHGDRVGVWAPNRYEWIVAAAGAQAAGGVLVPLNTRFRGGEAGDVLARSRARVLVTTTSFLGTSFVELLRDELGRARSDASGTVRPVAGLPALERIVLIGGDAEATHAGEGMESWQIFLDRGPRSVSESDARRRADAVSPDDLSDILFTSGTTGRAKGVMTTHGQNLRAFRAWSEIVGLRPGDRYLIVNPFFHAFGYKAGWLASLLCGCTILPHAVFDAPAVLARVARERISVLPGPPTLFQTILDHPERARHDLTSLRLAATGAAVIPIELVRRMRDELGIESVITGYGLTEASGVVTMCRSTDDAETIATTAGRPLPDVEIRCVDANGREVARGEPGEVLVRGYNVMRGYLDDPSATAEAIDGQGWLHTGDVGVIDAAGNLRITDRIKDMFIVGGFNCYPAEIERLMLGHPDLMQVAVVGAPDERLGEVGVAFAVVKPGRPSPAPEAIVAWCRERMANFKVPRAVEIVDALPLNASGKVVKIPLRERARALRAPKRDRSESANS